MVQRKASRDTCAPIATQRDEPGVSQAVHELSPSGSYPVNAPPRSGWSVAETEAGQRRNNDMECRPWRLAERDRIGQALHYLLELEERAGPPVSHDQRYSIGHW